MSLLDRSYFRTEKSAFAHLEKVLWADGVVCPHCGTVGGAGRLNGVKDKKGRVRLGLWKCYEADCRMQFTVRVGTVFESAHIPLHKMLQAVYLMCSSKKGVSAHQLHRTLEVTYKSAWFLAHRIREAMRDGKLAPMGGEGKKVEVDETYFGYVQGMSKKKFRDLPKKHRSASGHQNVILTLVSRGGPARSFHVSGTTMGTLVPIIRTNIRRESDLMTDEASWYTGIGREFESHETVKHGAAEYARGEVSTNTVEGYFSIFKRGMRAVYQHCGEKHLHRYLSEFDFRYNHRVALGIDDAARTDRALAGIVGKRLTYGGPVKDL